MSIIFGHPTGNPNSHQVALAHYEAGNLDAFFVPWMPSESSLRMLLALPKISGMVDRLARRRFEPLANATLVQGRLGEWRRLALRAIGLGDEDLSNEANDWLMRSMTVACGRTGVTAVHAYEDCSLWQFERSRQLGKACIYDMPTGYYAAGDAILQKLLRKYADWLPWGELPGRKLRRPEQKKKEMEMADLVLVPSSFVEETILRFHPNKKLSLTPYGVDTDFWQPQKISRPPNQLKFIYAGQVSLMKGIPLLLEAWIAAALPDAELLLVGNWQLASDRIHTLPARVVHHPACSAQDLLLHFQACDVFVFPSYFEGFGMVLTEALACGLPAIASEATAGSDLLTADSGKLIPAGDLDALITALRWFSDHRNDLPKMSKAARAVAEQCTWANYRRSVSEAVAPFI